MKAAQLQNARVKFVLAGRRFDRPALPYPFLIALSCSNSGLFL